MVADREIVRDRCMRIRRYVDDIRVWSELALDEFLRNRERQYAVLHALQLAIEACIEIGSHICSADGLGVPASYAETFDFLEQADVVDSGLACDLRAMARFRNRIVHFYWEVDLGEVYRIATEHLQDFDRFLKAVELYLGPTE